MNKGLISDTQPSSRPFVCILNRMSSSLAVGTGFHQGCALSLICHTQNLQAQLKQGHNGGLRMASFLLDDVVLLASSTVASSGRNSEGRGGLSSS